MLSHAHGDHWPRLRYPHANNHAALPDLSLLGQKGAIRGWA